MTVTTLPSSLRAPGVYPTFDPSITDWALWESEIDWEVVPFVLGPTWDRDPAWQGPRDPQGYILPELTLGWQILIWIEENLLSDETDENNKPLPFDLTDEQKRFILWFYAVDENGRFLYREAVLQRLKGWGKDPLATIISCVEFVGPCRFAGWATGDMPEIGAQRGDPVGKAHPRAWVQIAAVSLKQTQNTMKLFLGIFTSACLAEHKIDIGKESIYAYGGMKAIEAVTSSPASLEGNRPTLVIKNETHHWDRAKNGIAMAEAIERNATKSKGGAARTLSITNAYEPSKESVARNEREAFERQLAGDDPWTGVLYDSLEAPYDARMRPRFPHEEKDAVERGIEPLSREVEERITRLYIRRVLEAARGGAYWLDIPGLTDSILKGRVSLSRRFWYNQIVASEDAWVDPRAVDAAINPLTAGLMKHVSASDLILEACWSPVRKEDEIVVFFDGSKTDDSTALVGCRISDGYCFLIGVWQKPQGEAGRKEKWLAPRASVDRRVDLMFERFNVIAFWGDPSHAKDVEEDESSYWMPLFDKWMRKYATRLDARHWPAKGGLGKHAINFDMTQADRLKVFIDAAEQTVEDLETLNDIEEFEPTFQIDGHPVLVQHLKNAIESPDARGWGSSLAKEQKDSPRKIDAAVCLVGARMLRRIVLNNIDDKAEEEDAGEIW